MRSIRVSPVLGVGGNVAYMGSSNNRINIFAGAAAAYSMRIPLYSTYSGPLVRVRRSSDNDEQDFGAAAVGDVNGNRFLDTAPLLTFVGAGHGFVTTWYDQSGNGFHATQIAAINQPNIVRSGVLETLNSKPAVWADGALMYLLANVGTLEVKQSTVATVQPLFNQGGEQRMWLGNNSMTSNPKIGVVLTNDFYRQSGFTVFTPSTYVNGQATIRAFVTDSGLQIITRDGVVTTSSITGGSTNTNLLSLFGPFLDNQIWLGRMAEFVFFKLALPENNRKVLERSQGAAFGITVV